MRKILFIDRDGTLVEEPPVDYQLDAFRKLKFLPGVFEFLRRVVAQMDYELVMVTNQDGLGTDSFPEEDFWPVHNFIMNTFANEGIHFQEVLIDKSFPEDKLPTRKPGTAMLRHYIDNSAVDLSASWVIGDRDTDIELAKNLGAKGIKITADRPESSSTDVTYCADWEEIYDVLNTAERSAIIERKTHETDISIALNLNGYGKSEIQTGISFFDHMLDQLARHGQMDLSIKVNGDLEVDEHHTIEDTAIALGEAFAKALGNKLGIERYGFALPMDDCAAQVLIDFGGRSWLVWEAAFKREMIGKMPTEMFMHFFKSFADGAKANLNIKAEGDNEHHKIEAIFKAFAKAIKMAIRQDPDRMILPSTKGML
ncbi:MAG: bifunctional histidinol-phosphatase/imidazoleglycerol-phosphate dehydratase HisB [Flavobacteriaceae bacterium]